MMKEIYKKLETIRDVWNQNIWDYPYCQSEIRFDEEAKTNYFGDLVAYFHDTLDIMKSSARCESLSDVFSYHVSLLQILYVQQEFVEELLRLFSTRYSKKDLKKDDNYRVNRDIRNELIGHPISRHEGKLISSTLFSYESNQEKIKYLRYRKENNFELEIVEYKVKDILSRHEAFLDYWLDIIIEKLKQVVNKQKVELTNVKDKVLSIRFESLIRLLSQKYKPFLESKCLYDKDSILKIYEKRNIHRRYRIVYEQFMEDLILSLDNQIKSCDEVFTRHFVVYEKSSLREKPLFYEDQEGGIHIDLPLRKLKRGRPKKDYNYTLQKLIDSNRRNYRDFEIFSSSILSQCKNKLVETELNWMKENLCDDVEYISSYRLICSMLKA
jgi:hypothetical protein